MPDDVWKQVTLDLDEEGNELVEFTEDGRVVFNDPMMEELDRQARRDMGMADRE